MEPSKPAVFALLNLVPNLNSSSFILVNFGLSLFCCPSPHVPPLLQCSLASLVTEIYCSPASPFCLPGRAQTKHLHPISVVSVTPG